MRRQDFLVARIDEFFDESRMEEAGVSLAMEQVRNVHLELLLPLDERLADQRRVRTTAEDLREELAEWEMRGKKILTRVVA